MNINDVLDVEIIDIDCNGNGVSKYNNIVIFVKGVFLKELVRIRIVNIKKRFMIGEVIEILRKSEDRKKIDCPYFYSCGGCNFLHVDYDKELSVKNDSILKMFDGYNVRNIVSLERYNYRNKVTLHVCDGKIGYYKKDSNELECINYCLLLNEEINKFIKILSDYDLTDVSKIIIRNANDNDIMIKIYGCLNDRDLIKLVSYSNLKSLYFNDKLIYGDEYLVDNINGIKYTIYPDSFFQVNKEGMIKIYDKVLEYASSGNSLLDLYCGTGTIGIYLSKNYKKILGIEINKDAIKNANINKKLNNIENIDFICSDSYKMINDKYDTIIVDPPRSGLSNKVINNLLKLSSKKIIYVSCNPKTLKDNLNSLVNKYVVEEISIINMFPCTEHVECVILLQRKD